MMLVGVYDHNVLTAMAEAANLDLGVGIYIWTLLMKKDMTKIKMTADHIFVSSITYKGM